MSSVDTGSASFYTYYMEEHNQNPEKHLDRVNPVHTPKRTVLTALIGVLLALVLLLGGFFLGRLYVKSFHVPTTTHATPSRGSN